MSNRLPAAFADLEPLCEYWLHDTEAARNRARISTDMARIRAFYDAVMPRFDAMIQHLNQFPLGALPAAEENLLNLAFAFVEASAPVERFNSPIVTKTFPPDRFIIHEGWGSGALAANDWLTAYAFGPGAGVPQPDFKR